MSYDATHTVHYNLLLTALILTVSVFLSAQETGQDKAGMLIRKRTMEEAVRKNPQLKPQEMMSFFEAHAPDLLDEWKRRCHFQPEDAQAYMDLLVNHFMNINKLRLTQPEEYKRLVQQQKTESRIREISRKIQMLVPKIAEDNNNDQLKNELQSSKLELKTLMEKVFDETQTRQLVEINRLENELRGLKELAAERAANKQLILKQRFQILTGELWPEDD